MNGTKITPHFARAELVVTSTGLANTPTPHHWCALGALCSAVLEPWRERVGAIMITSGYRSLEVNTAIGGSSTSQHMRGEAADCIPLALERDAAWRALAAMVGAGLPVDQAIYYHDSNFIHVSHTARHGARRELLIKTGPPSGGAYLPWDSYTGIL